MNEFCGIAKSRPIFTVLFIVQNPEIQLRCYTTLTAFAAVYSLWMVTRGGTRGVPGVRYLGGAKIGVLHDSIARLPN